MMMPMMGSGMFWFLLLVIIITILLVVVVIQSQQNQRTDSTSGEKQKGMTKSAQEIAEERLAAGEISREEYRDIIDELKASSSS